MSSLILKRAPIGPNLEDFNVLEDGVVVGRIFVIRCTAGPTMDVGERAQRRLPPRRARLRADARGCDGGVRAIMAARTGMIARVRITNAGSGRSLYEAKGKAHPHSRSCLSHSGPPLDYIES
jgi:hypothetical protein